MVRSALLALLLTAVLAGSAPAATVPGQLVPIPPPTGCVGFWTLTFVGCATSGTLGGGAIALSPDARQLYVADINGTVAVVQRDPASGGVALDPAQAPCLVAAGGPTAAGCQPARAISGATDVVVSPDGAFVYVSGWQFLPMSTQRISGSVAVFARDPVTGALVQPAGAAGCVHLVANPALLAAGDETCADAPGVAHPVALTLSPDGAFLYVANSDGSVQGFARDATTGALTPVNGVPAPAGMYGVSGLSVSPDGAQLYVTGGAIAVVARDPASGVLSAQRRAAAGTFTGSVAFSADGAMAYVAGTRAVVTALRRVPATGALRPVSGRRGCAARGRTLRKRCARANLPVSQVIASGRFVYGSDISYGLSAFRATGGGLRALPGRAACLVAPGGRSYGCANTATGMFGTQELVATPDGRFVYVADTLVGALSVAG